jgi:hypothetical protein
LKRDFQRLLCEEVASTGEVRKINACRLVVNVYKHEDGKAFEKLRNEHPEYFKDSLAECAEGLEDLQEWLRRFSYAEYGGAEHPPLVDDRAQATKGNVRHYVAFRPDDFALTEELNKSTPPELG